MNLREWARVTHSALTNLPADQRRKDLSAVDVERVMRMSVNTLIEALIAGEDLRLDHLGRLGTELMPPRRIVSNLAGRSQQLITQYRRVVRFRPSSHLTTMLNEGISTDKHD